MKHGTKIKITILFTIGPRNIKCLGIKLTKQVQAGLVCQNLKMLMKEMKDVNKCRDIPCSQKTQHSKEVNYPKTDLNI